MIYSLKSLVISFTIVIIVVALMVLRTFSTLSAQKKEQEKITNSRIALQKLGPAIINMKEFESVVFSYFTTGDDNLLSLHKEVVEKLKKDSAALTGLITPSEKSGGSYRQLADIIHKMIITTPSGKKLQELKLDETSGTSYSIPLVDTFKTIASGLEEEKRQMLNVSYSRNIELTSKTFAFVRIIAALLVLIVLVSFYVTYNDIKTRKANEDHLQEFNSKLEKQVKEKTADLRESEKNLRHVLSSTPDNFYVLDRNYRVTLINEAAERNITKAWGRPVVVGTSILDVIPDEKEEPIRASLGKVFKGEKVEYELNSSKPGFVHWITVAYTPVIGENGAVIGAYILSKDITERKKYELELVEAEAKFRNLVEQSLVGVYIIYRGKFTYVNPQFAQIFGYDRNELVDATVESIVYPDDRNKVNENLRLRLTGETDGLHYELKGLKKNNEIIDLEVFGSKTQYLGEPAIIGTLLDISARKKAEEEREKAMYLLNERVKELTTLYRSGQVFQVEEKPIQNVLQDFVSILPSGWQYPEIAAARIGVGDMEFSTSNYTKGTAFHQQVAPFLTPDGQPGIVEVIYLEQRPAETEDAFLAEERHMINMLADMLATYLARRHEAAMNKLMEQEMLNQKVQEQKTVTRAILNAEEKERNKIGRELHDNVNQILAVVKLYLSMTKDKGGEEGKELLNNSINLVNNAIEEIRSLSKSQVTPLKMIDLKELIESLTDRLKEQTTIKIDLAYFVSDTPIDDDLKLNIYRIIQEQVNNILKHAEASEINIRINAENRLLQVSIEDNGKGFDVNQKRKGIGVANMINRVESFNGEIEIISSPGNGAKVEIRIPC